MIGYRFLRAIVSLAVGLFFRRIEVESRANVPDRGPVILAPNHSNALVDPLLLVKALPRPVTLTAKNVLANIPGLGWLIPAFGIITFHRSQDRGKGAHLRENVASLKRCREVLAGGGAICIFPEGVSHSDPRLREFQTGPARIALDFVRKDGNPGRLQVIPVGMLYTAKDRFRSDVWLRFGAPVDVANWVVEHPDGGPRELTESLYQGVSELTLNYESRRESAILGWAAEITATEGKEPISLGEREETVAAWFRLLDRLVKGKRQLLERDPELVRAVSERVRQHRVALRKLGVDPAEVHLPMNGWRAILFVIRELELVFVGAPLALFGWVNHFIPYFLVKKIATVLSDDRDHWATNVIYPSLILFPICYAIQLTIAWLVLPVGWAALYSLSLPFSGYYALLYGDRIRRTWRRARTFLWLAVRPQEREKLLRESWEIVSQIRELGANLE